MQTVLMSAKFHCLLKLLLMLLYIWQLHIQTNELGIQSVEYSTNGKLIRIV